MTDTLTALKTEAAAVLDRAANSHQCEIGTQSQWLAVFSGQCIEDAAGYYKGIGCTRERFLAVAAAIFDSVKVPD